MIILTVCIVSTDPVDMQNDYKSCKIEMKCFMLVIELVMLTHAIITQTNTHTIMNNKLLYNKYYPFS